MNIVILPGLDGSGVFVQKISTLLSQHHHVQVVQYPNELCRYEDLLKWLMSRMPKGNYIIVAESFSGPLAAMIGAKKPKKLMGIFFIATFVKSPRWVPGVILDIAALLPLTSRPLLQLVQPLLMGRWATRTFTDDFYSTMRNIPKMTIIKRLKGVIKVDVSKNLLAVEVPKYYIAATKDYLVPKSASIPFKESKSQYIAIEGPHFLLQAKPYDVSREILKHVQS